MKDEHEACVDDNGYHQVARYPEWVKNYLDYKRWKDGLDDETCDEPDVHILHLRLKGDGTVEQTPYMEVD